MKQIKFRAWNKEIKCWEYFRLDEIAILGTSYNKYENWCEFTGLKDKNGKEIFEGDILSKNNINSEVIFLETDAQFWLKEEDRALAEIDIRFDEVIGNKFENPELLK